LTAGDGIVTDFSTLGVGLDPRMGCHVELSGGTRRTDNPGVGVLDDARWESGSLDLTLGRRSYVYLSLERDHGGLTPSTQVYTSLSWRY